MMATYRMPEGVWALVPIKQLERAKSRLAALLDPHERKTLARAMLCDVLGTLTRVEGLDGILVVTSDPDAASLAAGFGATVIPDPVESGLNAAVQCGLRWLDAEHLTGAVIVPGDIPLVTIAELDAVLQALRSSPVVVAPALRDGGTNILAMKPLLLSPAFGPDSCARHLAAARALGVEPKKLVLEGAGRDIDVAADLSFFDGDDAATRTRACLRRFAAIGFPVPAGAFKEVLLP
jgi:2-phospho-L-lactate guanylyltransferase